MTVPALSLNPDIAAVGPGPEGCRCGECGNLAAIRIDPPNAASGRHGGQTLYYCTLSGQAKRVTWPACANFLPVESQVGARTEDLGPGTWD